MYAGERHSECVIRGIVAVGAFIRRNALCSLKRAAPKFSPAGNPISPRREYLNHLLEMSRRVHITMGKGNVASTYILA